MMCIWRMAEDVLAKDFPANRDPSGWQASFTHVMVEVEQQSEETEEESHK